MTYYFLERAIRLRAPAIAGIIIASSVHIRERVKASTFDIPTNENAITNNPSLIPIPELEMGTAAIRPISGTKVK